MGWCCLVREFGYSAILWKLKLNHASLAIQIKGQKVIACATVLFGWYISLQRQFYQFHQKWYISQECERKSTILRSCNFAHDFPSFVIDWYVLITNSCYGKVLMSSSFALPCISQNDRTSVCHISGSTQPPHNSPLLWTLQGVCHSCSGLFGRTKHVLEVMIALHLLCDLLQLLYRLEMKLRDASAAA